jgi:hypothetical protein
VSSWQYQSKAEPVSTQQETPQIDKWGPEYPSAFRKSPSLITAIAIGFCFFDPLPITAVETITCDKWISNYPNRIHSIKKPQKDYTVTTEPFSEFSTIRINCGGATSSYTDPRGNVWVKDYNYSTGTSVYSTASSITNTDTPLIYQTERYRVGSFNYSFSGLSNGTYIVTLKFAELFFNGPNLRKFNILIDGVTVKTDFDIFAEAGGQYVAKDLKFEVVISTKSLSIEFTVGSANAPKINAIEITKLPLITQWGFKTEDRLYSHKLPLRYGSFEPSTEPILNPEIITIDKWLSNYPNRLDARQRPIPNESLTIDSYFNSIPIIVETYIDKWNPYYPNRLDSPSRILNIDWTVTDTYFSHIIIVPPFPSPVIPPNYSSYIRKFLGDTSVVGSGELSTSSIISATSVTGLDLDYVRKFLGDPS